MTAAGNSNSISRFPRCASILLASDRVHADLYVRQPNGLWLLASAGRLEDVLVIESVGCSLKLADLYEKVEL
jgi:hypothetical protein